MKNTKPALRRFPGVHIDRDGKYYYYSAKTKTAYFIKPEDMKLVEVLAYRPFIAISVGVVLYSIMQGNAWFYFALSVVIYALLEGFVRFKMPRRCRIVTPYRKQDFTQNPVGSNRVWLMIGAYLIAAILLIWTIVDQQNEGASLAVLAAMIGICILGLIQNIKILLTKRD